MPRLSSRATMLSALCVVVLSVSGCGGAGGSGRLLTWHQTMTDYQRETSVLQLPAGAAWSREAAAHSLGTADAKQLFEAGIGEQIAQLQWYCAWARHALDHPEDRQNAAEKMRHFSSLSVWKHIDGTGRNLYVSLNTAVSRGDVAAVPAYLQSYCS